MKAKRLCALLLAGLLSLAPAVTLTSCSGGGGGGGDGMATNTTGGLPVSLRGRVVQARLANFGVYTFSFSDEASVKVDLKSNVSGIQSWSGTGTYHWDPAEDADTDTASISDVRTGVDTVAGHEYDIVFTMYEGRLQVARVYIDGDPAASASDCTVR